MGGWSIAIQNSGSNRNSAMDDLFTPMEYSYSEFGVQPQLPQSWFRRSEQYSYSEFGVQPQLSGGRRACAHRV